MTPRATRSLSELENGGEYEIPDGCGLWIRLNCEDGSINLESVPDQHYPEIHPNCHAPLEMTDVRLLHGGGSGTTVFHGRHPQLGSIVMKHGNAKDTGEVFSLASISEELIERSYRLSPQAASSMRARIPEFVMLYLSPYHLRDRGAELWTSLRGTLWCNKSTLGSVAERNSSLLQRPMNRDSIESLSPRKRFEVTSRRRGFRTIRIRKTCDEKVNICVCSICVVIEIPENLFADGSESRIDKGILFLQQLEKELRKHQSEQNWKVTLAQKTIGGQSPQNGADVLTSGNLVGDLRVQLVENFIGVVKDLEELTFPKERPTSDEVQSEVETLRETRDVTTVSKTVDALVGKAIKKNFHPIKGRFEKLREFGEDLRCGDLWLSEAEQPPGMFLGLLLKRKAPLSFVFVDPPTQDHALDLVESSWLPLLEQAVSLSGSSATECIWTCGLTDAGLHNTFLSRERGLELFDMGEATVLPKPAFLTKFLMSFFHTAGMEDNGTSWTRRFYVADNKLALTTKTKNLIPYLDRTFVDVMDRFVQEVFDGNENVRKLLVKYVVLQLLSDGAFCLNRWEQKGGGTQRHADSRPLEMWLWRCLWDCYIASHVHESYL